MWGNNLKTIPQGVDGPARLEALRRRVNGPQGPKPGSAEDKISYMRSDHMLVRFLIARQWDVEKAVAMLEGHYRWLAETNMEQLLKDPFPEEVHIKRFYPQAYHGTDKSGRPLYIERPGQIDMPRLLQVTTCERILQYVYAQSELQIRRRLPACTLVKGEVVDKSLNIMDLEGLSFRIVTHTTARKVVKDVVSMLQSHYPECSGRMVIINAPKVFGIAWSFIKPQLDEKTVAKISIFGSDQREAYVKCLLDLVDAEQLPSLYGGKCRCDGKDPLSCMRAVKGPWADPEVLKCIEEHPLDKVLSPEGATLLVQAREDKAALQAASSTAEHEESNEESEERDAVPPGLPHGFQARTGALRPELAKAEQQVAAITQECREMDEVHMKTLTDWVAEFNSLMQEIGRAVIERAQGYYDSRALWQQAVQDFAYQQGDLDQVNKELEGAVKNLAVAEAAFEAFLQGKDVLSDEQWEDLAPAKADGGADAEFQDADPKLLRMIRVSRLGDTVAALQRQRDLASSELAAKREELDEARRRFEFEDSQHGSCTWNCSVKRAAPFYEKRRMHELKVDQQLTQLKKVEQRLHDARKRLVELQAESPDGRSRRSQSQWDELSLQSFEIAGGEPTQDEFMSCDEDSSEDK
ncbi:unnamed protein product [Effrenium voratum]|uniref:CRAL-TRIO domain-containing protein n=1 Tax=Effrenium voratum TaxID=2562239 RepID=A0AA36NKA0_9DINO|nr:unnamed protein product [Effrenium voratum]CAJ1434534.1 unnamed protein product [Effrenium voratum]